MRKLIEVVSSDLGSCTGSFVYSHVPPTNATTSVHNATRPSRTPRRDSPFDLQHITQSDSPTQAGHKLSTYRTAIWLRTLMSSWVHIVYIFIRIYFYLLFFFYFVYVLLSDDEVAKVFTLPANRFHCGAQQIRIRRSATAGGGGAQSLWVRPPRAFAVTSVDTCKWTQIIISMAFFAHMFFSKLKN